MIQHMLLRFALAQASNGPEAAEASAKKADKVAASQAEQTQTWVQKFAAMLGPTIEKTTLTGWIILLGSIFGGLMSAKIAQTVLKNVGAKLKSRGWISRGAIFDHAARPAALAVFAVCLHIGLLALYFEPRVVSLADKIVTTTANPLPAKELGLLLTIALAWFFYNLVDLVDIALRKLTTDQTISLLVRKTLRIFLLILFALSIVQNTFEQPVTPWLAGLGLAGLAVSLAAQGPIKNIFGSVTVVLDRPFGLGDTIKYGDVTGTVENMGFRSTKLRTADGHLVTIPNMKLIDDVVENISARPSIRRNFAVNLTCDTPPAKIEQAIGIINDLLREPFMADTFDGQNPPRVYFTAFNPDSLNIQITYWYQLGVQGRDPWTHQAQCQEFNLKLLNAFAEAGIEMAYPSQTVYVAGDANRQLSVHLAHNGAASLMQDIRTGAAR